MTDHEEPEISEELYLAAMEKMVEVVYHFVRSNCSINSDLLGCPKCAALDIARSLFIGFANHERKHFSTEEEFVEHQINLIRKGFAFYASTTNDERQNLAPTVAGSGNA